MSRTNPSIINERERRIPCRHTSVSVDEWDFGIERETGYHDAGTRITCHDCGEVLDGDDFRQEIAAHTPQAGEVYYQFGIHIVILEVTDDVVYCVARSGPKITGSVRRVSRQSFLSDLSRGLVFRTEPAE